MDTDLITNWIGGVLLAAVVVGAPTACSVHTNYLKAQAISEGADPIAVDCAYSSGLSGDGTKCVLTAARLQQSQSGKEAK